MSVMFGDYTYQIIADKKLIQLLDRFNPSMTKIPLSALMDQALALGGTPAHFGQVWNVDLAAAAGGDGTPWAPFNTIQAANAVAAVGDKITVTAGNGVSFIALQLHAGIEYQIVGRCIANTVTISGVGVVSLQADDLVLTATAAGAICTLGSGQYIAIKDSYIRVIHTLVNPLAFHIPATSSAAGFIMYNSVLREGDGGTSDVVLIHCEDELSVVAIDYGLNSNIGAGGFGNVGSVVTNDAVAIRMEDGMFLTSYATIVNSSAASPTVLIANATGGAPVDFINSRIVNLGTEVALAISGDNAMVQMGKCCWLESGGVASMVKTSVASSLNPVPCSLLPITVADFNATALGEAQISHISGDPNTAGPAAAPIGGTPGQVIEDIVTGNRYVCTNTPAFEWVAW